MVSHAEEEISGADISSSKKDDLLRKWLTVGESQICALEVLSEEMPKINELLEADMSRLSDHFSNLTKICKEQEQMADSLLKSSAPKAQEVGKSLKEKCSEANQEIGNIVICMQFQDRVSQNMVISIDVMRVIVAYLEEEINMTLNNFSHSFKKKDQRKRVEIEVSFAKKVIEKLWLGDLRNSFVNHLLEHGYIEKPEDVGHMVTKATSDGVDLF
jgi:hypothetical protein